MTSNRFNTFNLGFQNKHFELKVSENISPVDLNIKNIAIFQTKMSPGHHDEIYERNKLPLNIVQSNKYCKKASPFNLHQFFPAFSSLQFFCISVAVLLKCFSILQVG